MLACVLALWNTAISVVMSDYQWFLLSFHRQSYPDIDLVCSDLSAVYNANRFCYAFRLCHDDIRLIVQWLAPPLTASCLKFLIVLSFLLTQRRWSVMEQLRRALSTLLPEKPNPPPLPQTRLRTAGRWCARRSDAELRGSDVALKGSTTRACVSAVMLISPLQVAF